MAQDYRELFEGLNTKKFNFPLKKIPRVKSSDDHLISILLKTQNPVVITDTHLVDSALHWDLDYLEANLGNEKWTVFQSPNHLFKYYDEEKVRLHNLEDFDPPFEKLEMHISKFAQMVKNWKPGDKRVYLQGLLFAGVGPNVVSDFKRLNWDWVKKHQLEHGWGPLTNNLLMISLEGNVTPLHFDEQENFLCQIHGYKQFILFPPDQLPFLYPHPTWHPHDRQSQVDIEAPDLKRFPRFKEAQGLEAILGPGEVIYIPNYWWHYVATVEGGPSKYAVSLNFWYKSAPAGDVKFPLNGCQKMVLARNIENTLLTALQDVNEVGSLLRTMVLGRYFFPTEEETQANNESSSEAE